MNIFQFCSNLSHLAAILILLNKITNSRSCAGLSGKSQLLYAIALTTRFLDIPSHFIPFFSTITFTNMFLLASSYYMVKLVYYKYKHKYNRIHDTFWIWYLLVLPAFILALFVNHAFTPRQVLRAFSIYLEAVAIMPQLFMITKIGKWDTMTSEYFLGMGLYGAFNILGWLYRYLFENVVDLIALAGGIVQTILLSEFFYIYWTGFRVKNLRISG